MKARRVWVDGSSCGVHIIPVDPPLADNEVEIELEPIVSRTRTGRMNAESVAKLAEKCKAER